MLTKFQLIILTIFLALLGCEKDDTPPEPIVKRNFKMGFTSWPYAATLEAQQNTYNFLRDEGDIYAEHIDDKIPWSAWINNTSLPQEFVTNIESRKSRLIPTNQLLVSVSLFNNLRTDLAEDYDGFTPSYDSLNQRSIQEAYVKHLNYIIDALQPEYLILVIEANELLMNSPNLWEAYKKLISKVRSRIKSNHSDILLSESITLHNWYKPNGLDPTLSIEIKNYVNQNQDFVAISYYPFFQLLATPNEYQRAFDFLHQQTSKPIAFAETAQIAETLTVPNLNINIASNTAIQQNYLETLLANAEQEDYEFVIWWCHRDYDVLWQTFPPSAKDLGQLWRDSGLLDENGNERPALSSWRILFQK